MALMDVDFDLNEFDTRNALTETQENMVVKRLKDAIKCDEKQVTGKKNCAKFILYYKKTRMENLSKNVCSITA